MADANTGTPAPATGTQTGTPATGTQTGTPAPATGTQTPAAGTQTGTPATGTETQQTQTKFTWTPPKDIDPDLAKNIEADAQIYGWSPESATKFASAVMEQRAARIKNAEAEQKAFMDKRKADFEASIKSDKDLGGDRFAATMQTVERTVKSLETKIPGLQKLLADSDALNEPVVVRLMHLVSTLTKEDSFVGGGNTSGQEKSLASLLYGGK
jgi:hypothetical protein